MSLPATEKRIKDRLGRPLHDLRISVIDRCNLRCTYCMPAETYHEHYQFLAPSDRLRFDEIDRLARLFVEFGVSKLRITGGEPLLRQGLPDLVARLAAIEGVDDIALTTNGLLLHRWAADLKAAGLHRITVSLDSVDDAVFGLMNGCGAGVDVVMRGIAAAQVAGFSPIKVNVVVQRGVNDAGVVGLARTFRHTGTIVRFIEYMDVGTCNGWKLEEVVPSKDVLDRIHAVYPLVPLSPNYHGEVADRYAYADGGGEIGFISSVTEPFCGACSRARLSTDGRLYTCLFATEGADLRGPMRGGASDDGLRARIAGVWHARADRYSEQRAAIAASNGASGRIEMYQIGG